MEDYGIIEKALQYLQNINFNELTLGHHKIDDTMYANIDEYYTKTPDEGQYEAHKKYIDIQYMIYGEEIIQVASIKDLVINTPYSDEKDVTFYKSTDKGIDRLIRSGEYIILYPEDAHRPCIAADRSIKVKKVVIKVKI